MQNIQRSNEEQKGVILDLELLVEQFEVEVDTVNHQQTIMVQEHEHKQQLMEVVCLIIHNLMSHF